MKIILFLLAIIGLASCIQVRVSEAAPVPLQETTLKNYPPSISIMQAKTYPFLNRKTSAFRK
jgi:hypothetical protein